MIPARSEDATRTLDRLTSELRLRGYSPRTIKVYRGHAERFLHSPGDPAE